MLFSGSGLELVSSTSTVEPETSRIEETTRLAEGSSTAPEAELSGEGQQTTTGGPEIKKNQYDEVFQLFPQRARFLQ